MMNFARGMKIWLALSLVTSPAHGLDGADAQAQDQLQALSIEPIKEKIKKFIKDFSGSEYVYVMSPEQVQKLIKENNIRLGLHAQLEKINEADGGPEDDVERYKWTERKAAVQNQSVELVREIFAQPVVKINTTLLWLIHQNFIDKFPPGASTFVF